MDKDEDEWTGGDDGERLTDTKFGKFKLSSYSESGSDIPPSRVLFAFFIG